MIVDCASATVSIVWPTTTWSPSGVSMPWIRTVVSSIVTVVGAVHGVVGGRQDRGGLLVRTVPFGRDRPDDERRVVRAVGRAAGSPSSPGPPVSAAAATASAGPAPSARAGVARDVVERVGEPRVDLRREVLRRDRHDARGDREVDDRHDRRRRERDPDRGAVDQLAARRRSRFLQAVPRAADRDDPDAGRRQLRAKPAHLDVDRVRAERIRLVGPGVLGDRLAVDHGRRAAHEQLEDVVFGDGEADRPAVGRDLAPDGVERESAAAG